MKPFDDFWKELLAALDIKKTIRNWSADKGYSPDGRKFTAQSWRSAEGTWEKARPGLPINAEESVICTQLTGDGSAFVEKYHAERCYGKWSTYSANKMSRQKFEEGGHANSYLISIFKEFDKLTKDANSMPSGLEF